MKKIRDEIVKCPYCGTTLLSRYAMRQHLTLKVCQGGNKDTVKDDLWKSKKLVKINQISRTVKG